MNTPISDWRAWYSASDPSPQTLRLRTYQLTRFAESHPDLLAVTTDDLTRWLGRTGWSTETRRARSSRRFGRSTAGRMPRAVSDVTRPGCYLGCGRRSTSPGRHRIGW